MFLNIGFSNDWWNKNHGLDFGRDTYMDPVRKMRMQDEMDKAMYGLYGKWGFLDHLAEVGTLSKPSVAVEPFGHRFLPAMFGVPVCYQRSQAPWAEVRPLSRGQIMALGPITKEEFAERPCVREVIRQCEALKGIGRPCSAQQNLGSVANTVEYLRGMDMFYDFADDPELTHTLNLRVTEMLLMAYEYFAEYDGVRPGMGIGNCSVAVLSPGVYREFFYPYDRMVMERARENGVNFYIHQDSRVDPFIPAYRAFEYLHGFDIGEDTDVRLFRENFPDITINIYIYTKTLRTLAPREIYGAVMRLADSAKPLQKAGFSAYDIDPDVPEASIDALCEAYSALSKQ